MATQHGARLVFDNAKALVKNAGFEVNQAVLSQSYLRSEVAMSTSTTSYHVPVLINDTQNVLQDYGGDVNQAYEQRFQRPLTWVPTTPPKTSRTSPKTKEILSQVEQPPAVAPVPNNGNESSLMDFLPDPIQNIFR